MNKDDKIPGQMKAVVLTGPGEFEVSEIPVPDYSDDEVLCRVESVAICGSDPKMFRGETAGKWPPRYPFVIGHEWSGVVAAVGQKVKNLRVGDRVAAEAHSGCGVCTNCLRGAYNLCENYGKPETGHRHYGHLSTGAYAQFIAFSEKSLSLLPDNVSFDEGALVDTVGAALHAIQITGIRHGDKAVVVGPGAIGLMAIKLLKVSGASKVIAVGRGYRLDIAGKVGADSCIDFEDTDPVQAVLDQTDRRGADLVIECSGAAGTLTQAVQMTKKGGKVSLIGIPSPPVDETVSFNKLVLDEISIVGSRANPNVSKGIIELISSAVLNVADIITHRFELNEFPAALDTFVKRKDNALKVIVHPNS